MTPRGISSARHALHRLSELDIPARARLVRGFPHPLAAEKGTQVAEANRRLRNLLDISTAFAGGRLVHLVSAPECDGVGLMWNEGGQPTLVVPYGQIPPLLDIHPETDPLPMAISLATALGIHEPRRAYLRVDRLRSRTTSVLSLRVRDYAAKYREGVHVDPIEVENGVIHRGPHRAIAALQLGMRYILAQIVETPKATEQAIPLEAVALDFLPQTLIDLCHASWDELRRLSLARVFSDRCVPLANYLFMGVSPDDLGSVLETGADRQGRVDAKPIDKATEAFQMSYLAIYLKELFAAGRTLEALRYVVEMKTGRVILPSI